MNCVLLSLLFLSDIFIPSLFSYLFFLLLIDFILLFSFALSRLSPIYFFFFCPSLPFVSPILSNLFCELQMTECWAPGEGAAVPRVGFGAEWWGGAAFATQELSLAQLS